MSDEYVIAVRPSEPDLETHGKWEAVLRMQGKTVYGHFHMTPWEAAKLAADSLQFELEKKT